MIRLKSIIDFTFIRSKTFELAGFTQLVHQIADSKKVTPDEIIPRITSTGGPSLAHVTVEKTKSTQLNNFFCIRRQQIRTSPKE